MSEDGTPADGDRTSTYQRGYDKSRMTREGQRIFDELDAHDVDITIEVIPDAEVGGGDAWGTARPSEIDSTFFGGLEVREIEIHISDAQFDSGRLANTIHHELRHAEGYTEGNFHGHANHRALDDGKDSKNVLFRAQVGNIESQEKLEGARREAAEPRPPETVFIGPEHFPNYTRIMEEAGQAPGQAAELARIAKSLGYAIPHPDDINDYLDSIEANDATFTSGEIDIEFTSVIMLEYSTLGVDLKFNESVFECGAFENGRRVVCPTDVQDMPAG